MTEPQQIREQGSEFARDLRLCRAETTDESGRDLGLRLRFTYGLLTGFG
jgi:hypothetical protein